MTSRSSAATKKRAKTKTKTTAKTKSKTAKRPAPAKAKAAPKPLHVVADDAAAGARVDRFLADALPQFSRSQIRRFIDEGRVHREGHPIKASEAVVEGAAYDVTLPKPESTELEREPMDLDILYQDKDVLVINKPAGLTVHPSHTQRTHTLVNGLLALDAKWSTASGKERPGIVHRLDKNTSGVMIVAKHDQAHRHLVQAFSKREVDKSYVAIVFGVPSRTGEWTLPIGRHPTSRQRFSTKAKNAKSAHTKFELIESYGSFASLIRLDLLTGRTHQIRVHASDAGHPLLGDMLYAGRRRPHKTWPEAARTFERQALHSEQLTLTLPNGKRKTFKAPWPADLTALRKALKNPEKTHA